MLMIAFALSCSEEAVESRVWDASSPCRAACASKSANGAASSAKICADESLLTVIVPLLTKYFSVAPALYTVTTPGFNTAMVGT